VRNLIIGLDGTWNRPDQVDRGRQVPSNVVKIVRAIKCDPEQLRHPPPTEQDFSQLCYYDTGVGTAGAVDKLWGGAAGRGLFGGMRQAYAWLMLRYRPGDRLFLFGFSRGAFAVRSLAGLLDICGIPDLAVASARSGSGSPEDVGIDADSYVMTLAEEAARIYRLKDPQRREAAARKFREQRRCQTGAVHFLGVWDTVGALGLPSRGPLGWLTRRRHAFHNVCLGDNVRHARQALAINERRAAFEPALWRGPCPPQVESVQQVWFPGVHSNVGGGYVDPGLSDLALKWMVENAARQGLQIDPHYLSCRVDPNVFGELRDSLTAFYRTPVTGSPRWREIGSGALAEAVHASAYRRWRAASRPEEMPPNLKVEGGIGSAYRGTDGMGQEVYLRP